MSDDNRPAEASENRALQKAAKFTEEADRLAERWSDRSDTPYEKFMQASIQALRMRARVESEIAEIFRAACK